MRRRNFLLPTLLAVGLVVCPPAGNAQTTAEFDELKATMIEMQKTINALNAKITDLEQRQKKTESTLPAAVTASSSSVIANASPSIQVIERVSSGEQVGTRSPVRYRDALNDQQVAASRPLDYTLDPQYRGFVPIPNTPALIKFNAKPRLDMTFDNKNAGTKNRFIPAKFPLKSDPTYGGGGQFNLNANGTQLRIDVRAPELDGNFRFYYQNDFFGEVGKDMKYRLQHIYGQYYGFKAGFTYSIWENPDVWPDTVDYEGPNSVIFARRPVLQYTHAFKPGWNMSFGVEKPDIFIDGGTLLTRMPDLAVNSRWESGKWGHLQLSGIVRDVGARNDKGSDQHVLGWGVNLGGNINITQRDSVQFLGIYGEGIGGMGNDTSFLSSDAGFTSSGDLQALKYWSALAALTHRWNDDWRSTITFGHAHLDPASGQSDDFYNFSYYSSANLIWQVRERWSIGVESLYGYKEAVNGDNSGGVWRIQLGMVYALFD